MIWEETLLRKIDKELNKRSYKSIAQELSKDLGQNIHVEALKSAIKRARRKWANQRSQTTQTVRENKSERIYEQLEEDYVFQPAVNNDQMFYIFDSISENETIRIGLTGDEHVGSKYFRKDVFDAIYNEFREAKVNAVVHCGNYVDGCAPFNKNDLVVPGGIDNQLKLFISVLPELEGAKHFIVSGKDHEGWSQEKEGIDVGERLEDIARRKGRDDIVNIGYMEANVHLARNSGIYVKAIHAGGGSAQAISYKSQQIARNLRNSLQHLPTILAIGHYHKSDFLPLCDGMSVFQVGTCQDQTPFMRQKMLSAHLGAWICEIKIRKGVVTSIGGTFITAPVGEWRHR